MPLPSDPVPPPGTPSPAPAPGRVTLTGIAQKGPLDLQSVMGQPLDVQGRPQGAPIVGELSEGGRYRLDIPAGRPVEVQLLGRFEDEISGETIQLEAPLTALVWVNGNSRQNVNLGTHFSARQALGLAAGGERLLDRDAIREAEIELVRRLGFEAGTRFGDLDLLAVPEGAGLDDANLQLALLSASLMSLPREPGRMPDTYDALSALLGTGLGADELREAFTIFNGLEAVELARQLQNNGRLPGNLTLPAEGLGWTCTPINCGFLQPEGLSLAGTTVYESRGVAEVVLRRSGTLPATAQTVRLRTLSEATDTAEPHRDYLAVDRVLSLPPGQREVRVRVPLLLDRLDEVTETFRVELLDPSPGLTLRDARAQVTVLDGLPPGLAAADGALQLARLCLIDIGDAREPLADTCTSGLAGTPLPLLDGLPQVLKIAAVLQASCPNLLNCPPRSRDWLLDLELVAERNGSELSRHPLGAYAYAGRDVRLSAADVNDSPQIHLRLDDPTLRESLLEAARDGAVLRLAAALQARPALPTAVAELPRLVPISATVRFGDREVPLLPRDLALTADGTCPQPGVRLSGRFFAFEAGITSLTNMGADMGGSLFPVDVIENASDEQSYTGSVCIGLESGGPLTEVTRADLLLAGPTVWRLPPRQGTRLDFAGAFPNVVFPGVLFAGTPPPNESGIVVRAYYQSEGLPFEMRPQTARLTQNGLSIGFAELRYLQTGRGYSATDLRSPARAADRVRAFASNDVLFSRLPNSFLGTVSVAEGVSGTLGLPPGEGSLAYPRMQLAWNLYSVPVRAGLLDEAAAISVTARLEQNADCEAAGCARGSRRLYEAEGSLRLAASGTGLGTLAITQTSLLGTPGFGVRNDDAVAVERPDDLPVGASLQLAFAGYRLDLTRSAAAQLPGHVEPSAEGPRLHPAGSEAYRLGNHAPAGLSVGPALYADAQGQPAVGAGRDLAGLPLRLNTGDQLTDLAAATATKYVLRPGGYTGVFNAQAQAIAAPVSYAGFPLQFSRFAFRAVDNRIDPETWIDGRFEIPGDAGIENLVFASLGLDCSARFAQGRLVAEACDGNDSNGNGVIDENCPTVLAAWSYPTTVQSLRFGRANGAENAPSCAVEPQVAILGQSVRPLAIDRAVSMELGWNSAGTLAFQQARGLGQYRLDETPDNLGFGIRLQTAELRTRADPGQRGWLQGDSLIAVPFWQALEGAARLENRLQLGEPQALPSLLLPGDGLTAQDDALSNAALAPQLPEQPRFRFDVRYEWGRTGFNFNLPEAVYFSPAAFNRSPRFSGVRREKDLIVFNIGAGINFIEPERTKMSFGASADLARLRSLEFQINLEDPDSLEAVDSLLVRSGIVRAPVLAPTFTAVQERLFFLNRFANEGLDRLVEAALLRAVTEAGTAVGNISPLGEDPFLSLSKGISQLRALPELVENQVHAAIRLPLEMQLDNAEASLRSRYGGFRAGLASVPVPTLREHLQTELRAIAEDIDGTAGEINRLAIAIDPRVDELQGLLDQAAGFAGRAETALDEIDSLLDSSTRFASAACTDSSALAGEASGYLRPVFEHLDNTAALLEGVQGAALLLPIIEIVLADSPELVSGLRSGQVAITATADDLLQKLRAAEERLKGTVCSADVAQLLMEATDLTTRLRTEVTQVLQLTMSLNSGIDQARALRDELLAEVVQPLSLVAGALRDGADTLETVLSVASANDALDLIEAEAVAALNGTGLPLFTGLTRLVGSGAVNERDLPLALRQALDAEFDARFGQPLTAAREQVQAQLPGAHYTPEELRLLLVGLIMDSAPVTSLRRTANDQLVEIHRQVNTLFLQVTDQVNTAVKGALSKVEGEINELIAEATAPLNAIPLDGAKIDGLAVIAGQEIERVHVGAEFTIPGTDGEDPKTFGAAMEAVSWNATGKTEGCSAPGGDLGSNLDVTLSAFNLPARFGTTELLMKKIYMGFTLEQGGDSLRPVGVYGGLQTQGQIGFTEFIIFDPGFAAGFGTREIYLGARAGAVFSDISAEVAFLAGRTCNKAILEELDPTVGQFIPLPDSGFFGVYARGAATIPIIPGSCALSVSAAADFGGWLLAGPPVTLGGLVGGGAIGRIGCVAAIRGQLRALGQVNTQGDLLFVGEGFVVGGVGLCEPPTWSSVERSREDSFCATFDARIRAQYLRGWSILDLSAGGPF